MSRIEELTKIHIEEPDKALFQEAEKRWDSLAKPIDGFGEFEKIISRLAAIQGGIPDISGRSALIFCSDNGIVEEGVSQSTHEVTRTVTTCLGNGTSTACVLAEAAGIRVIPIDVGIRGQKEIPGVIDKKIREGTRNFLKEPAMTEEETILAIKAGMEIVRERKMAGDSLIVLGEMGIGNTTTSAALLQALLFDEGVDEVTGRGAGLDDAGLDRKKKVVKQGVQIYRDRYALQKEQKQEYTFSMLMSLGGLDIAALTGAILGGAVYRIPILLDGVITGVAAVTAELLFPGVKEYLIASHAGREKGNMAALRSLGLKPLLLGDMALGEGTGAIMLLPALDTVLHYYKKGADFSDYGMDSYERLNETR